MSEEVGVGAKNLRVYRISFFVVTLNLDGKHPHTRKDKTDVKTEKTFARNRLFVFW
jgi:hypothetical protein